MSEEKVELEEGVIDNPEVKAILESYTTIMLHKDLVDKLTQYSMIKGKDNWEQEFEKLLDREISKESELNIPSSEPTKTNVKKFKL